MALKGPNNGLQTNTRHTDEQNTLQTLLAKLQSISDEVDSWVTETNKQGNTIRSNLQSVLPEVAKLIEDSKIQRRDDLITVRSPVSLTTDAQIEPPVTTTLDYEVIEGVGSWKATKPTSVTASEDIDQTQGGRENDFDQQSIASDSDDQEGNSAEAGERSSPLSPPPPSLASINDIVDEDSNHSTTTSSSKEKRSISPPRRSSKRSVEDPSLFSNVRQETNDDKEEDSSGGEDTRQPLPKKVKALAKLSTGPKRYTAEEIDIICTATKKFLKTHPTKKVFELVSKELKKQGYDRTPGTLAVQWYTKFKKLFPSPAKSIRTTSTYTNSRSKKVSSPNELYDLTQSGEMVRQPLLQSTGSRQTESESLFNPLSHKPATTSISKSIVHLRLGSSVVANGKSPAPLSQIRKTAGRYFVPSRTWTGASNDVLDVSWSPSGLQYVAGNAAQEGRYNRGNNLLLGSTVRDKLRSLPDHRIARPESESALLEPWSYTTVSSVAWSDDERWFYSASYDSTVKVWDVSQSDNSASCVSTWQHEDPVTLMSKSCAKVGLVATGTSSDQGNLRVYPTSSTGEDFMTIPLSYLHHVGDDNIRALKFGRSTSNANQLLAGFGSDRIQANGLPAVRGYLGLWRFDEGRHTQLPLSPYQRQVFDVAWSPRKDEFLAGCSGRGMKAYSVIRLYSTIQQSMTTEIDCVAADINEVSFCDFNDNLVLAAATNGTTYLWDIRRADKTLLECKHGVNAAGYLAESDDTGVRIVQWGSRIDELFTGSSDGALKQWDVRRHQDDALVENVMETGIELMCGRLSPDRNDFLVGDAAGSIHILSRSAFMANDELETLGFEDESTTNKIEDDVDEMENQIHHGSAAARKLIESGEIEIHPEFGPVQGPRYGRRKKKREYSPVLVPEIERTKRLINMSRKRAYEEAFEGPELIVTLPVKWVDTSKATSPEARPPYGSVLELFATEKHFEDGGLRSIIDRWNELSTDEREQWSRRQEEERAAFKGRNLMASKRARVEDLSEDNETGDVEDELGDEDGSDHWFPPAWTVDANIGKYRSET